MKWILQQLCFKKPLINQCKKKVWDDQNYQEDSNITLATVNSIKKIISQRIIQNPLKHPIRSPQQK